MDLFAFKTQHECAQLNPRRFVGETKFDSDSVGKKLGAVKIKLNLTAFKIYRCCQSDSYQKRHDRNKMRSKRGCSLSSCVS